MKKSLRLWLALALLVSVHAAVLFAGFFAPYSFSGQHREMPFAPPTRVHFFDRNGHFHFHPFVYGLTAGAALGNYTQGRSQIYPVRFFVPGAAYKIGGVIPSQLHLFGVQAPGKIFLFGTDEFGRDQLSRFLYGGQISLAAGLIAAGISVFLGIVIGTLAGFYGGWVDDLLMRGSDLFMALPWLYLLFFVRAALPLQIAQWQVFMLLVTVMGLIGWTRPARLIRGVVLSAKERNFVLAARGFGASDFYLMRRHALPQAWSVVLTQLTLLIPQFVLAEVTLTFLGIGVGEPMPSWGSLLASLQQYYVLASYWWMFLPALLLIPIFLAYFAAADALQEHVKSTAL